MGKVVAWAKAHWAPALGIGLAIAVAAWFFIFRKSNASSGGVSSVSIPAAGAAGGVTGAPASNPVQSLGDTLSQLGTDAVNAQTIADALKGFLPSAPGAQAPALDPYGSFANWISNAQTNGQRPDILAAIASGNWGALFGQYQKELASKVAPPKAPAAALRTPIATGAFRQAHPLAGVNLGNGGLGSGNSPSIAPGGPLKELVPTPVSFSKPALPKRGPV